MKNETITILCNQDPLSEALVEKLATTGYCLEIYTSDPEKIKPIKTLGQVGQIWLYNINLFTEATIAASKTIINCLAWECKNQPKVLQLHQNIARILINYSGERKTRIIHCQNRLPNNNKNKYWITQKTISEQLKSVSQIIEIPLICNANDGVFSFLATTIARTGYVPLVAGLQNVIFDVLSASDAAEAIMANIFKSTKQHKPISISGITYSLNQILTIISHSCHRGGKFKVITIPKYIAKIATKIVSITGHFNFLCNPIKLQLIRSSPADKIIEWQPKISFEEFAKKEYLHYAQDRETLTPDESDMASDYYPIRSNDT